MQGAPPQLRAELFWLVLHHPLLSEVGQRNSKLDLYSYLFTITVFLAAQRYLQHVVVCLLLHT